MDRTGNIGDVVQLSCEAESYPPPSYMWLKDHNIGEVKFEY